MEQQQHEVWFLTGSQKLYGEETLRQVAEQSRPIAAALDASAEVPVRVVWQPVLTDAEEIRRVCLQANATPSCIGVIAWMHTFSPAKMWIGGLQALQLPLLHLHTQANQALPWAEIDMDFMNLNQSAHGGREFGFMATRLRLNRKVIVGHWQDPEVQKDLAVWMRAAAAWHDSRGAKIARFGDNMREVAVTEGDKVEAQIRFGYSVNGYGLGDLVAYVNQVADAEVDRLVSEYEDKYVLAETLKKGGSQR
ncbi:MAG TPA: L-arabinose isomerase, partial [Natronosporangium sp.]